MLNIEVYPLNCIIYPDKDSDLDIIRPWAKNYIRWNEYWNKWQKRKVVTPAANYVFFRRDRKQVNILRTMFDDLIGYLAMSNYIEGVHYRVIQKKLDIDIDYEHRLTTKEDWTPRGEQIDLIDFASKKDYGAILMGLLMGVGKSASLATLIRVPGGWRKMGSLRVGDKIYAYNGEITTVMSVHPQGLQPIYRVHVDGFRYVDVTLEHLFKIIRIDNTDVDITATTTEIIKLLNEGKKLYIPHNGKIEEGKKLTVDESIIDTMYFIKQFFIDEESNLNTVKLDSLVSSSYLDRKAFVDILIKVLLEEGKDNFRDNRVLDYIKELVFSIGYGIESVEEGEFVKIKIKEKVERVLIKKIERVEDSYAQCISIDHPSQLYLTKDYVVNHNTSSSLFLAEKFQQRLVCILRPNLGGSDETQGWFKELAKATTLNENEICVVRGRKDLQSLINMGLAKELPYRAILISNKTFQYYLKYYEEYTDEEFEGLGWNCSPKDLPNVLGVDTIFLDEVHLDSHLQCKMISYLGCKRILGASATIKPSSKFIDRMSKMSFPIENRYMQKHVTAYIQPTAFHYKFEKPQFIRCEGSRGYSHVKFEQSVMRHVGVKKAYFKMVNSVIKDRFINRFHLFPQSKCLVVVSTINMAKEMTTYLREQYPDLKVNSYVADDPQENVFGSNITVSTIGSSGVGLDIPDLNTVILTVAVSSKQTNLQVAGRLRFLGEGVRHEFIYFVCDDIASHVKYDVIKRNEVFPGSTCLNGVHWYSNIELGNRYTNDKNR